MVERLRWGILGTGSIAHTFASDLAFSDECVVAAVGSRLQSSADAFGAEFGVTSCFDTYEALVDCDEVDVVYVATPHPMHYSNAMLALDHGKPVLVEKAFTMTALEARDLVAAARKKGLFLMEAMWTRFLPHVIALRSLIDDGVLGEIVTVEADHGQWFAPDPSSRIFAPELGGGALLDLGVYPVSFASMIMGTPERLTALITPTMTGVDGQTSMLFGYANGAHAILTCTSRAHTSTRACVSGTKARVEIEGDFYAPSSITLTTRNGDQRHTKFTHQGRGLHFEASEVARCLRESLGESDVMPLDESISIMTTMERVLKLHQSPMGSRSDEFNPW